MNAKTENSRNRKLRKESSEESEKPVEIEVQTKYPILSSDVSSNWKKLSSALGIATKKRTQVSGNAANTSSELWFHVDGLPSSQLSDSKRSKRAKHVNKDEHLVKEKSFDGLTKVVAMDCEMVGVGKGGQQSILARVSIVNHFGHCLYDKFVKPTEKVTDYRTKVSGIRPRDIQDGQDFKVVQKEVYDIIKGRILVGHAITHDLKVLFLDHPKKLIRDTSKYFRYVSGGKTPSLKRLSEQLLGVSIQTGEHNSVEDARVAMRLYTMHRKAWDKYIKTKRMSKRKSGVKHSSHSVDSK
ncbi:RNA exonuclease 4-like protein [Dinothrombium tinctorium]|uniref:RNA exonuclease 4 n=1 Tax=Dinothrombium tinctorium TaxID=1965070 RepID=A0A3S3P4G3_9ACAR|nr:RNA exonuclease 4-like protein [Dinothrombium tinctorium]